MKKYVLVDKKGRYYMFWDKQTYGEPEFSKDPKNAKVMTAQGCASAKRMLDKDGYYVERQEI